MLHSVPRSSLVKHACESPPKISIPPKAFASRMMLEHQCCLIAMEPIRTSLGRRRRDGRRDCPYLHHLIRDTRIDHSRHQRGNNRRGSDPRAFCHAVDCRPAYWGSMDSHDSNHRRQCIWSLYRVSFHCSIIWRFPRSVQLKSGKIFFA